MFFLGGGGQKINFWGDRKSLWIFWGIIRKQGYFGGYLYAIMVKVLQNGIFFLGGGGVAKISNIFEVYMPKIPDI